MSFGIYSVLVNGINKKENIKKEKIKQKEQEVLCDKVLNSIAFLQINNTQKIDDLEKKECSITPIVYNKDFTKFKDLSTGKVYPVVLTKTVITEFDKEFLETAGSEKIVKGTNKVLNCCSPKTTVDTFNKIDDIKKYYNWESFFKFVDFSEIQNDYGKNQDVIYHSVFDLRFETAEILRKDNKIVPDVFDVSYKKEYTIEDIKTIAKLSENVMNECFEKNFKTKQAKKQEENQRKQTEKKQENEFRNF